VHRHQQGRQAVHARLLRVDAAAHAAQLVSASRAALRAARHADVHVLRRGYRACVGLVRWRAALDLVRCAYDLDDRHSLQRQLGLLQRRLHPAVRVHAGSERIDPRLGQGTLGEPAVAMAHDRDQRCAARDVHHSVVYLVALDSWIGRTFMYLDLDRYVWNRPWARALIKYFRAIGPFRIINGYGVFAPHADPPLRVIPVFEGTNDGGATWRGYRYKYLPTRPDERPRFASPHHPRFENAMYYAGLASTDASFFGVYVGDGVPYTSWTRSSALDRGIQRLLSHDPFFLRAFVENPFPDAPPQQIRVSAYAQTAASLSRWRATGEWWHMRKLGELIEPTGKQSWPDEQA